MENQRGHRRQCPRVRETVEDRLTVLEQQAHPRHGLVPDAELETPEELDSPTRGQEVS